MEFEGLERFWLSEAFTSLEGSPCCLALWQSPNEPTGARSTLRVSLHPKPFGKQKNPKLERFGVLNSRETRMKEAPQ